MMSSRVPSFPAVDLGRAAGRLFSKKYGGFVSNIKTKIRVKRKAPFTVAEHFIIASNRIATHHVKMVLTETGCSSQIKLITFR